MSTVSEPLAEAVSASWRRFLDTYEPLRPELYRYCRHLTRSPWDAEDMAQETLARAFVMLGLLSEPPQQPRAWLFRVASNLWLNRARQRRERLSDDGELPEPSSESSAARETREAAGTLLGQLAPRERAAVVLKEAFGLSLEEIAETLATSTGAVKAALHRGRSKLVDAELEGSAPVAPVVLDEFCAAFNARDLERITGLLLESATMEFPGLRVEHGARALRAGSLGRTLGGCTDGQTVPDVAPRCELRAHRDQWLMLWWWGSEVHAVVRVELDAERIARLWDYHHCPEVMTEVCRELRVPFRTHGYRPTVPSNQELPS
jgi:RNA polymerase sigma-70 factor (ECF subfamily)